MPWEVCAEAGCGGAAIIAGGPCLAHAPTEALVTALGSDGRGVDLDGRGVQFSGADLTRVLELVPRDEQGRPLLGTVRLDRARFSGDVPLDQALFAGDVSMNGAVFSGSARFGGASFARSADFSGAQFESETWFVGASFGGEATFRATKLLGPAWFQQATFRSNALFEGAHFAGDASLTAITFFGVASFWGAAFDRTARFERSTSVGGWRFEGTRFQPLVDGAGKGATAQPAAARAVTAPPPPPTDPAESLVPGRSPTARPRPTFTRPIDLGIDWRVIAVVAGTLVLLAYIIFRPEAPPIESQGIGAGAGFGFLHEDPKRGTPTRYNPCEPIRFVVNPALGPQGWNLALDEAMSEVNGASGLDFQPAGTTDEVVKPDLPSDPDQLHGWPKDVDGYSKAYQKVFKRPSYQPERYGKGRWAPLLIAWVHFGKHGAARNDDFLAAAASDPRKGPEVATYVSGTLLLNADAPLANLRTTLMHELAHVVGLSHVGDPNQLMFRRDPGLPGWGAGDVQGLRRVGEQAGCVEAPRPPR